MDKIKTQIAAILEATATSKLETMGFDTSKVWYHGSTKKFNKFKEPGEKGINELGVGVYLCDSWNYANAWAKTGGYVHKCFIKTGEIFDFSKPYPNDLIERIHAGHSKMMFDQYGETGVYSLEDFKKFILKHRVVKGRDKLPTKYLKWAGYMGAIDPYSQIPGQIVIFDKSDVMIVGHLPGGMWGDHADPMNEEIIASIGGYGGEAFLFKNASRSDFLKTYKEKTGSENSDESWDAGMVRGLLDPHSGDVYFWDGYVSTHYSIKERYNIPDAFHLSLSPKMIQCPCKWRYERMGMTVDDIRNTITSNKNLQTLYNGDVPVEIY